MQYTVNQKKLNYLINDSLYFKYLLNPRALFVNWQIFDKEKYKFPINDRELYLELIEDAYIEFLLFKDNVSYSQEFIDNIEYIFKLYENSDIESCIGSINLLRKMTKERDKLYNLEENLRHYKSYFMYNDFNSFKEVIICNLKYSSIRYDLDYNSLRAYCHLINTDIINLDYALASMILFLNNTHLNGKYKNIIDNIYIENNEKVLNLIFDIKGENLNEPYKDEYINIIINKFISGTMDRLIPICEYNIVNYNYGNKYILPIVNNIDYLEPFTQQDYVAFLDQITKVPLDKISHIFTFYK